MKINIKEIVKSGEMFATEEEMEERVRRTQHSR